MGDISISGQAYCKIILHAAKYPHCAINGLLLAKQGRTASDLQVVDAVPLFHICLHVSPMSELALNMVISFKDSANPGFFTQSVIFNFF